MEAYIKNKTKKMKPSFRQPVEIEKRWGKEIIFANNDKYCGKLLCFNKGNKFSFHYHIIKQESFYLFTGQALIKYFNLEKADKKEQLLNPGDIVDLPVGCPHQIEALENTVIIEVSTHHEDSDSYRVEKGDSQIS